VQLLSEHGTSPCSPPSGRLAAGEAVGVLGRNGAVKKERTREAANGNTRQPLQEVTLGNSGPKCVCIQESRSSHAADRM